MNRPIADETSGSHWWLGALLVLGLTIAPLLAPLLAVATPIDPPAPRADHAVADIAFLDDVGVPDGFAARGSSGDVGRRATPRRADR